MKSKTGFLSWFLLVFLFLLIFSFPYSFRMIVGEHYYSPNFKSPSFIHPIRWTESLIRRVLFPEKPVSGLATLSLTIPKTAKATWDARLPKSTRTTVRGTLNIDNQDIPITLRLRGFGAYHWLYPKRSYKFKTPKNELWNGYREWQLINLEDKGNLSEEIAYRLSDRLDLIHLPSQYVQVWINGAYHGVYWAVPEPDETWLIRNHLLPGQLLQGDIGLDSLGKSPTENLFQGRPWKALTHKHAQAKAALSELVSGLQTGNPTTWEPLLDLDYFVRFLAFVDLWGVQHYDAYHNFLLIWDPVTQTFQQVSWDNLFPITPISLNIANNLLYQSLLEDPSFLIRKYQFLWEFLSEKKDEGLFEDPLFTQLASASKGDYLDALGFNIQVSSKHSNWDTKWDFQKSFLKAMFPYPQNNQNAILKRYSQRRKAILTTLSETSATYSLKENGLKIDVLGPMPISNVTLTVDSALPIQLYWDKNGNARLDSDEETPDNQVPFFSNTPQTITIGPGTFFPDLVAAPYSKPWFLAKTQTCIAPQSFAIVWREKGLQIHHVRAENAVTHTEIEIPLSKTQRFYGTPNPTLFRPSPPIENTVVFSGVMTFSKPVILPATTHLYVKAGTHLQFGKSAGLVVNGTSNWEGSAKHPITIQKKEADEWRGIALTGPGPHRLQHVSVQGTVSDPLKGFGVLSGIHTTVYLNNCQLANITSKADAFYAYKSHVYIVNSQFLNCDADSIDWDYCSGTIQGCTIQTTTQDGIDLMTSSAVISDTYIAHCQDKAISVGQLSSTTLNALLLEDALFGVGIRDGSKATLSQVQFSKITHPTANLKESWRYGD